MHNVLIDAHLSFQNQKFTTQFGNTGCGDKNILVHENGISNTSFLIFIIIIQHEMVNLSRVGTGIFLETFNYLHYFIV